MLTSTTIAGMYRCRVQKADSEVAGQQIRHECAAKWKGFTWLGLCVWLAWVQIEGLVIEPSCLNNNELEAKNHGWKPQCKAMDCTWCLAACCTAADASGVSPNAPSRSNATALVVASPKGVTL
jgi:hypothetical protein